MANLKIKDENGNWVGIASLKGEPGPQGPQGIPGTNGKDGVDGTDGKDGVTPTFEVGTVTTGEANVEMTGENNHYTLDFTFPEGGGGTPEVRYLDAGTSTSNPVIMEDLDPGIYMFKTSSTYYYLKLNSTITSTLSIYPLDFILRVNKKPSEVAVNEAFAYFLTDELKLGIIKKTSSTSNGGMSVLKSDNTGIPRFTRRNKNENITGSWTFNSYLPTTDLTPTQKAQFTNKAYVDNLINVIYPVGCYFETSDISFNPNTSFGGTWVLEEDGTVLVSKSNVTDSKFNTGVGTILGEEEHQLTKEELPKIDIQTNFAKPSTNGGEGSGLQFGDYAGATVNELTYNINFGDLPHNNIQPSKIVNRWHRTA